MEPYVQANPTAFNDAFQNAIGMGAAGLKIQALQQAQQAEAQKQAFQEQQQGALQNLYGKIQSGNATQADYEQAMALMPEHADAFQKGWAQHTEDEKQNSLSEMSQVYSALQSKRPDIAKEVLQRRIDALKNAGGSPAKIQAAQTMLDNIDASPDFAQMQTGLMLQSINKDTLGAITTMGKEKREQELQPGELAKQQGELVQQGLQAGLTKAQTNEVLARTRNLGLEGKKLVMEMTAGASQAGKPLAPSEIKLTTENLDNMQVASGMQADIDTLRSLMNKGQLNFGMLSNAKNAALNKVGHSTPESQNYAKAVTLFNKVRNDFLSLQKGVQTEGDAQRAWDAMFPNMNDNDVMRNGLDSLSLQNGRAVKRYQNEIDDIRFNKGLAPLDYSKYAMPSAVPVGSSKQQQVPGAHPDDINALLNKYGGK